VGSAPGPPNSDPPAGPVASAGGPPAGIDPDYLRNHQYKDPTNLHARIALHAKHTVAAQPWYGWVAEQMTWHEDDNVLEVGCGSGVLWTNIAPQLPGLRLTLTDLSEGMLDVARESVAPVDNLDLVDVRTCDVQELPFHDDSFDVVIANHMLYHVPDRDLAVREIARVLRPDGVLMAATNGPHHLEQVSAISKEALGWATMDFVSRRFGMSTGGEILEKSFGVVEWRDFPSSIVCDEPDDVYNFIASSSAAQRATAEQMANLRMAVERAFEEGGGLFRSTKQSGCFLAREPKSST
jgi:ubiquinone/menaquinone biosynthesis C-methylase UbiE